MCVQRGLRPVERWHVVEGYSMALDGAAAGGVDAVCADACVVGVDITESEERA